MAALCQLVPYRLVEMREELVNHSNQQHLNAFLIIINRKDLLYIVAVSHIRIRVIKLNWRDLNH